MIMKQNCKILLTILLIMGLAGCASILPTHSVNATVVAATNVNPNIHGRPSPVVVTIYQLKGIGKFNAASFNTLYQNPSQALGGDYISQKQVEVAPGETQVLTDKLDPKALYVGVVAAFSDQNNATWRQSVKFQSTWATESLLIQVSKNRMKVDYLM